MKILHLEDFKNEVVVITDWLADNAGNTGPTRESLTGPDVPSIFPLSGGYFGLLNGITGSYMANNNTIRRRIFKITAKSENNAFNMSAVNANSYPPGTLSALTAGSMDMGIYFPVPVLVDEVEILRFEFTYTGPSGLYSIFRQTLSQRLTVSPISSGQKKVIEIVHTPTETSIYVDNSLLFRTQLNTSQFLYYGRWVQYVDQSVQPFSFKIENMAVVRVPLSSRIRRLYNVRVDSVPVSKLNGTVQDNTSPINALNVLTSAGENLSGTNSVEFSPITLQDKEKVLGSQTTMVVKSLSADQVSYSVKDGTTELQSKTIPVSSTLNTREVLGDNQLEDYSNLNVELTVVDLEE